MMHRGREVVKHFGKLKPELREEREKRGSLLILLLATGEMALNEKSLSVSGNNKGAQREGGEDIRINTLTPSSQASPGLKSWLSSDKDTTHSV